eukprot:1188846-Prorocentrum_minimum.AAC.3
MLIRDTRWSCRLCIIWLHTVVLPEAVPPATPMMKGLFFVPEIIPDGGLFPCGDINICRLVVGDSTPSRLVPRRIRTGAALLGGDPTTASPPVCSYIGASTKQETVDQTTQQPSQCQVRCVSTTILKIATVGQSQWTH